MTRFPMEWVEVGRIGEVLGCGKGQVCAFRQGNRCAPCTLDEEAATVSTVVSEGTKFDIFPTLPIG